MERRSKNISVLLYITIWISIFGNAIIFMQMMSFYIGLPEMYSSWISIQFTSAVSIFIVLRLRSIKS